MDLGIVRSEQAVIISALALAIAQDLNHLRNVEARIAASGGKQRVRYERAKRKKEYRNARREKGIAEAEGRIADAERMDARAEEMAQRIAALLAWIAPSEEAAAA